MQGLSRETTRISTHAGMCSSTARFSLRCYQNVEFMKDGVKQKVAWTILGLLLGIALTYFYMMIRVRAEWDYEDKLIERIKQLEAGQPAA